MHFVVAKTGGRKFRCIKCDDIDPMQVPDFQAWTKSELRPPKRQEGRLMQYQGIEYTIVQTADPFGWKWSFEREGRSPKTGISYDRVEAILAAEGAINQALKEKRCSK